MGSPFAGHELCTSVPYFNGLILTIGETMYSFHPHEYGHAAYAKVVADYLAANPS